LVLLDLNLPKMDGREVLAEIKSDQRLRAIPVVVLTTSAAEEDILRSYDTYANAYVTKPVDFNRFMDVIRQIDEFFVAVVQRAPERP
jgi:CheY-like chemotaxis protein